MFWFLLLLALPLFIISAYRGDPAPRRLGYIVLGVACFTAVIAYL